MYVRQRTHGNGQHYQHFRMIVYIIADSNYSKIYDIEGKLIKHSSYNLAKEIENYDLIRVSRGAAINKECIKSIEMNCIILHCGRRLTISKTRIELVKHLLK